MYHYRRVEARMDGMRCTLRCNRGRYHIARALNALPPADVPLRGDTPHLGFGMLVCLKSGAVYRVIFESINDAQMAPDPERPLNPPPGSARTGGAPYWAVE